jgi:hypothetical protein
MTRESRIDPPQIALAMPMRRALRVARAVAGFAVVGAVLVTRGAYALRASGERGGDLREACRFARSERSARQRETGPLFAHRRFARTSRAKQSSARSSN